jgi:hypothetical protein
MKAVMGSIVAVTAVLAAGCQSSAQFMQQIEPIALQTAVKRGQFEMGCPGATGTVLSKSLLQPAVQAIRFSGPERAEFSVGVEGCGKRATYTVICPMDSSGACWDVGAHNVIR